jgi:tartrate/fumarate subfamily iron-sulfur-dependent hydro-lyase beta chain
MTDYHLATPVPKDKILSFHIGDIIYLTGKIFTARDKAHQLILTLPRNKIPAEIHSLPLYHCGPLVTKEDGRWHIISAGPTTSRRMESSEAAVMQKLDVHLLIGKGGMGPSTAAALQKQTGVYLAYTGGAGVLAAEQISNVLDVIWYDELGMADAVWLLEVREFGPLVIAMDSYGASMYPRETE